jgi:predicted  nucleic acid-binding Zn-ribbon protein
MSIIRNIPVPNALSGLTPEELEDLERAITIRKMQFEYEDLLDDFRKVRDENEKLKKEIEKLKGDVKYYKDELEKIF